MAELYVESSPALPTGTQDSQDLSVGDPVPDQSEPGSEASEASASGTPFDMGSIGSTGSTDGAGSERSVALAGREADLDRRRGFMEASRAFCPASGTSSGT
jgi:hypothetical protein